MNSTSFQPRLRVNVQNKNNSSVNITFLAKTSDIRNFPEIPERNFWCWNIRSGNTDPVYLCGVPHSPWIILCCAICCETFFWTHQGSIVPMPCYSCHQLIISVVALFKHNILSVSHVVKSGLLATVSWTRIFTFYLLYIFSEKQQKICNTCITTVAW